MSLLLPQPYEWQQNTMGWTDQNGNFHPQGNDDLKVWISLKTSLLSDICNQYRDKGMPDALLMSVFGRIYRQNKHMDSNLFRQKFIEETDKTFESHKVELAKAKELQKQVIKITAEEKEKGISYNETGGVTQSAPIEPAMKIIKLGEGLMFNANDFSSFTGNKLKLVSQRKAIT